MNHIGLEDMSSNTRLATRLFKCRLKAIAATAKKRQAQNDAHCRESLMVPACHLGNFWSLGSSESQTCLS